MRRRFPLVLVVALAIVSGVLRAGAREPEKPQPLDATFARIVAKVGPAIVRVEVDGAGAAPRPERRFFRDLGVEPRDGGAGVVIRKDGLILTHAALVSFVLPRIEVLTASGRRLPAELLAREASLDIALLKVDPGSEPLVPVELGTTVGLEAGRLVLAFGNPFGIARDARASASLGVVSFVGPLDARDAVYAGPVIGTDAAVNPGNDGGALVDLDGRLLGILAPLVRDRRSGAIVAHAIPCDAIVPRLEALARGPTVRLGVLLEEKTGAVARVVPGGSADRAGVKEGDKIVSLDGKDASTPETLKRALVGLRAGQRVRLVIARGAARAEDRERLELDVLLEGER